jgi:hypothetical protein
MLNHCFLHRQKLWKSYVCVYLEPIAAAPAAALALSALPWPLLALPLLQLLLPP